MDGNLVAIYLKYLLTFYDYICSYIPTRSDFHLRSYLRSLTSKLSDVGLGRLTDIEQENGTSFR